MAIDQPLSPKRDPLPVVAAVRCYPIPLEKPGARKPPLPAGWRKLPLGARVLVFDTECTVNRYQNLLFGSYRLCEFLGDAYHPVQGGAGVILGDVLSSRDRQTLRSYAEAHSSRIWSRESFVRDVFLPEVYELGSLCVGFNLPFDLSRLAVRFGFGRGRSRGAFLLYLVDSEWYPPLHIQAIDSKRAFIRFRSFSGYTNHEPRACGVFPGHFLDLKTGAFVLTGDPHSLESACEAFGAQHGKVAAAEHGRVTPEYIAYNLRDVEATWELYLKVIEEWNRHPFGKVPGP